MTDKYIVKVRMLGACVIITVPAAVREVTGIESGNYVYVETNGKRGFTITKGALPVKKKKPTAKAAKPLSKTPSKKKVAKPAPKKKATPKVTMPKPKLTVPPMPKKKLINKPAPAQLAPTYDPAPEGFNQ